jgi:hypothetical protein
LLVLCAGKVSGVTNNRTPLDDRLSQNVCRNNE